MTPIPPLPPSGRFTRCVRESSRAVVQAEAITVSVKYLTSNSAVLRLGTIPLERTLRTRDVGRALGSLPIIVIGS
jgi:hypothetical protein